jgi:hypothetical protein
MPVNRGREGEKLTHSNGSSSNNNTFGKQQAVIFCLCKGEERGGGGSLVGKKSERSEVCVFFLFVCMFVCSRVCGSSVKHCLSY